MPGNYSRSIYAVSGVVSNLDTTESTQEGVLGKHDTTLCKVLEHPWVSVSAGPETTPHGHEGRRYSEKTVDFTTGM